MGSLHGCVVLVTGAGAGIGRAVALRLAAAGARLVLTGPVEKPLAEAVGEIACAAGKARHVVVRRPEEAAKAVDRAIEAFGGLDVVVATGVDAEKDVECICGSATSRLPPPARLVVTAVEPTDAAIAEIFERVSRLRV